MDIGAAVTAIDYAIRTSKRLSELSKELDKVELREALLELREQLADAKEKNIELREYLYELEERLTNREALIYDVGVYWKVIDPEADERDGPFCPACYDDKGKLVRLADRTDENFGLGQFHRCTVCDFDTSEKLRAKARRNNPIRP